MTRLIGIRHRRKKTTENEARPTMVAIAGDKGRTRIIELADDNQELDFVLGRLPKKWRPETAEDDLSSFPKHHVRDRKVRGSDEQVTQVPSEYEGFQAGDAALIQLGGSGDRLAFALSRRGVQIGAMVYRIPSFIFKDRRGHDDTDKDHIFLTELFGSEGGSDLFYEVSNRDRALVLVSELHRARREAQQARIACEQRIYQRAVGAVFLSEEGQYQEGTVEDHFDRVKANDEVLANLVREERQREQELKKAVHALSIWDEIFEPVTGCGEVIASGIISTVLDIRRFDSPAKLKAFMGVHVMSGGKNEDTPTEKQFPRQRKGQVANWNGRGRQALYLLGDQFVKRADSFWGKKLREHKERLREKHPEVEIVEGKKRYTNGYIHKMAIWRTLSQFTVDLWWRWWLVQEGRVPAGYEEHIPSYLRD